MHQAVAVSSGYTSYFPTSFNSVWLSSPAECLFKSFLNFILVLILFHPLSHLTFPSVIYFPRANSVRLHWSLLYALFWAASLCLESSPTLSTSLFTFKEFLKTHFCWETYYADFPISCILQVSFPWMLSWPNLSASTLGETHYLFPFLPKYHVWL